MFWCVMIWLKGIEGVHGVLWWGVLVDPVARTSYN